jgi:hypothetical protein
LRLAKQIVLCVVTPAAALSAQVFGGIGPVGQVSSSESAWKTSAQLWGAGRFENGWTSLDLAGSLSRTDDAFRFGNLAGSQRFFSPAAHGFRSVTSVEFQQRPTLDPLGQSTLNATTSLSYRHGTGGAWLGLGTEQRSSSLRLGGWRQVGDWLTVSVSSSARRKTSNAQRISSRTLSFVDTIPTDSGDVYLPFDSTFADTSLVDRTLGWLETEGRIGLSRGRVAFDVVAGLRPAVDSSETATGYRATATVALSKGVALSAGTGTATRQVPYARSIGHYATIAVRLAPSALVRPKEIPEITPAASSFRVERAGSQYAVRVRLPRARVVELSGDFNSWQPVRLTRDDDGSWVALLDLRPGAYRMNIRIDGEQWVPPPGTTAVDDEFNGKVGLVVVR